MNPATAKVGDIVTDEHGVWRVSYVMRPINVTTPKGPRRNPGHVGLVRVEP